MSQGIQDDGKATLVDPSRTPIETTGPAHERVLSTYDRQLLEAIQGTNERLDMLISLLMEALSK